MTKQLVRYGIAVMTTLLGLVVLWQFRVVVIYVLISVIVAAALRPLITRLAGRRWMVRAAWIVLYLLILGTFAYFLFLTGEIAVQEVQWLARTVSAQDGWTLPVWLEGSLFQQAIVSRLPPPSELFAAVTGSRGELVLPAILGFTQDIGGVLSGAVIILLLSVYWSISQFHFERLWLSLLPSDQRKHARGVWRTIGPNIGAYIRGQIIQSLLSGLVLCLGYWLLGSPYAVLLALAGALASFIPVVGVVLVVILPLLVGLLTSLQLSLFTVLYALLVMIILGVWVKPRLFTRRWDNPILSVILLIVLANAFGIVGILVAPPISVVCQILWSQLVSHRLPSGASAQISDLMKRKDHVLESIHEIEEPPLPLLTSSLDRLTRLLVKAEPILETVLPEEPSEGLMKISSPVDLVESKDQVPKSKVVSG